MTVCCAFRLNQYISLHSATREGRKKIILISLERWMKKCELVANAGGKREGSHHDQPLSLSLCDLKQVLKLSASEVAQVSRVQR